MAVAFGAITTASGGAGRTTLSGTGPTVSGSNTRGWAALYIEGSGAADNLTGITWGGVAMTFAKKHLRTNNIGYEYLYYIDNPASGATVIASASPSSYMDGLYMSYYTGVSQGSTPVVNSAAAGPSNSLSTSVTTVADNSWIIGVGISDNGGVAAGTGMTSRGTLSGAWIYGDSNAPKTPAGSYTIGLTGTGNGNEIILAASMAPAVAASGPTNLKSLDGNLKANVKSFCGNLIANIKSITGNA